MQNLLRVCRFQRLHIQGIRQGQIGQELLTLHRRNLETFPSGLVGAILNVKVWRPPQHRIPLPGVFLDHFSRHGA
jgi:hypothetical protein